MKTTFTGIQGATFDGTKPAYATFWKHLGAPCPLYFTGRSAIREEFGQKFTEFEMEDDGGGVNYVSEADLYQR